jgi:RNA polymerase sigma-70 factor, ECF subfamily
MLNKLANVSEIAEEIPSMAATATALYSNYKGTVCMDQKPDVELIALGKLGNQQAITELFGRHYSSSLSVARRIMRWGDEAQDAVQAAYCSAFQHFHTFREESGFKTWITRIVINYCLMHLRQRKRWSTWVHIDDPVGQTIQSFLSSSMPNPEQYALHNESVNAVHEAVADLPAHAQQIFNLFTYSGLSLAEISETLGLSLPAAKSRLFRARVELLQRLNPERTEASA